mgnify:CR=1 FL=1
MARTEQQSNEKYGGRWFWRYASPAAFFPLAGRIEALCWVLAIVLSAIGLYLGFFVAPTDAQQGEAEGVRGASEHEVFLFGCARQGIREKQ